MRDILACYSAYSAFWVAKLINTTQISQASREKANTTYFCILYIPNNLWYSLIINEFETQRSIPKVRIGVVSDNAGERGMSSFQV